MAFNSEKVAQMVRDSGIKAKDYFRIVYPDRTKSGNVSYKNIAENDNPKAEVVERIADLLQCPIDFLFDRDAARNNHVEGDNNTIGDGNIRIDGDPEVLRETNKHLRDIINRQDKTIEELNRRIDQLIELARR